MKGFIELIVLNDFMNNNASAMMYVHSRMFLLFRGHFHFKSFNYAKNVSTVRGSNDSRVSSFRNWKKKN